MPPSRPAIAPLPLAAFFLLALAPAANAQERFVLPASWSFPPGSQEAGAGGFSGAIHQARKGAGLSATIARGNAQLRGDLVDPGNGMPFVNVAVTTDNPAVVAGTWPGTTPVDPGGFFTHAGAINFAADTSGLPLDLGNFTSATGEAEQFFPGLPGANTAGGATFENGLDFAVEFLAWLDLPQGEILLGVHHDDAVEVAFHPSDARDIFRSQAVGFDSNSGATNRTVLLEVEAAGLYPVRVLLAQWNGDALLEFYTADPAAPGDRLLVNGGAPGSVAAWHRLSVPARPHIAAVSPPPNATGVEPDTAVVITVENLGDETPQMRVNGVTATYERTDEGDTATLTHTRPLLPFEEGQAVTVDLDYGAATASWTFVVKTGRRALLITGGGQLNAADGWVANRLATRFGFDVVVVSDALTSVADAEGVNLIFNSSTVSSNNVADDPFEELPIPLINVESANIDDFRLTDAPYAGKFGNNPSDDAIIIEDPTHPLAAGLGAGEHTFASSNVQFHRGVPAASAELVATAPNFPDRAVIFGLEEGAEVMDPDGSTFEHPARRVYFGHTGNEGAALYNAAGVALFDAAITWVLSRPVELQVTAISRSPAGAVDLTWEPTQPGQFFALERTFDLRAGPWATLRPAVPANAFGESTSERAETQPAPAAFYRVRPVEAPPLFADGAEGGLTGWTIDANGIVTETAWEAGPPANVGPPGPRSGANVFGTDLDAPYGDNLLVDHGNGPEGILLRSPRIDLLGVPAADLSFWYFWGALGDESGAARVSLLDGATGATLEVIEVFDAAAATAGWTLFEYELPAAAIAAGTVILEFELVSDNISPNGAGFYLDDIEVRVP